MRELADKFAEIEKRVKALVAENAGLKKRTEELERELAAVRRETRDIESLQGRNSQIREKIESVLSALEAVSSRK